MDPFAQQVTGNHLAVNKNGPKHARTAENHPGEEIAKEIVISK